MMQAGQSETVKQDSIPVKGTAKWVVPNSRRENRVLDTTMRVTTPENISFHYQVAGPFRRVFAYGLDLLISIGGYGAFVLVIYLVLSFAVLPLATRVGGVALVQTIMGVLGGMIAVGYFIVYWFYGAYMETYFNGQTLGKRATRMRVISTNGHAIDGVQAVLRNFFRLLDLMPFAPIAAMFQVEQFPAIVPTCLFGLVIMTLTKNFQRVGDLVAGTVVVNEDQKQRPNLATFIDERVPKLSELIPTSFVVPASMAGTIADYIDQRKFLPFQRASEIAGHLAIPLMEKFGIQADTDHDLFLCAMYYKTFVSSENSEGYSTSNVLPGGNAANPVPAQDPHVATNAVPTPADHSTVLAPTTLEPTPADREVESAANAAGQNLAEDASPEQQADEQ